MNPLNNKLNKFKDMKLFHLTIHQKIQLKILMYQFLMIKYLIVQNYNKLHLQRMLNSRQKVFFMKMSYQKSNKLMRIKIKLWIKSLCKKIKIIQFKIQKLVVKNYLLQIKNYQEFPTIFNFKASKNKQKLIIKILKDNPIEIIQFMNKAFIKNWKIASLVIIIHK